MYVRRLTGKASVLTGRELRLGDGAGLGPGTGSSGGGSGGPAPGGGPMDWM